MIEYLTLDQYEAALREDFASFVARCFRDLNPQAKLAMNWHHEVIATKLMEVREGRITRLIMTRRPRSSVSATRRISPTSLPAIAAAS